MQPRGHTRGGYGGTYQQRAGEAHRPLTKGRAAAAVFFFALGCAVLVFRHSKLSDRVHIEVYAGLCLLLGLAVLAFGVLASDRLLIRDLKPGRQARPGALRAFYVISGVGLAALSLVGFMA